MTIDFDKLEPEAEDSMIIRERIFGETFQELEILKIWWHKWFLKKKILSKYLKEYLHINNI